MPPGGCQQQPAAIRCSGLAPGVLSPGRGAHRIIQGCLHDAAACSHTGSPGRYGAYRHQGAGSDDRLWLCHGPMPVAAVEELQSEDDCNDVVAAIPAKKQFQHKQGGHPPRADRASKWPAAMLGRASLSAGFTRGMARRPASAPTRTVVPGRETRWLGGSGHRLLWP